MNDNNTFNYNSFSLLSFIAEKRKILFFITLIALILSIVISLLITPKFKSTVVLFPSTYNSISRAVLNDNPYNDIIRFGEDEEIEQLLQVLYSSYIRQRIIEKHNLIQYYEINPRSAHVNSSVYNLYQNNVKFRKTEYMSVEIEVLDKDAQKAADIANDIADLVDTVINNMQKTRAKKALEIVENEFLSSSRQIQLLEDSLTKIQRLGIHSYDNQAERYNQAYAFAITEGKTEGIKRIEEKLNILSEYGVAYINTRDMLTFEKNRYNHFKEKYIEAKVEAEQELPQKFVVNQAIKSDIKTYPVRWMIVFSFTLSSFIIALLTLVVLDKIVKKK